MFENAHKVKNKQAIPCMTSLSRAPNSSEEDTEALPFFISCGNDSTMKIFEHNLYRIKTDEEWINQ